MAKCEDIVVGLQMKRLNRFSWIIESRKAQIAIYSVATIILTHLLPKLGFSADDVREITAAVAVLGSVIIAGIAHEDAAEKSAAGSSPAETSPPGSQQQNGSGH